MQITYQQQYKDLGDRKVIAMGPNENFVPIKKIQIWMRCLRSTT